jgi:hypothetical protein
MATMLLALMLVGTFGVAIPPLTLADTEIRYLTVDFIPSAMPTPSTLPSVGIHNLTLGSLINVEAPEFVNDTTGVRYEFVKWAVFNEEASTWYNTTNRNHTVTLNANKTAYAVYKIQYLFTVITAYDLPYIWESGWHQQSTRWFDAYVETYASVANEHVDLNFSMKAKFVQWTGDWVGKEIRPNGRVRAGPINMTGPMTVIAEWVIEYFLTKDAVYSPHTPSVPYVPGAYYTSLEAAIDRIVLLQNTSSSAVGDWDWITTGDTGPSNTGYKNLQGVIALGLLCAFELTENISYFQAAQYLADEYLATGNPTTGALQTAGYGYGADFEFLARFSEISGRPEYLDFAQKAWEHQKVRNYGSPAGYEMRYGPGNQTLLYNHFYYNWALGFGGSHGVTIWNYVSYITGALAVGDTAWAENATAVVAANLTKILGSDWDRFLGWGQALVAFQAVDPITYATEISNTANSLIADQLYDGSWPAGSWKQDAAYAIMGLAAVGEMDAAQKGADWLVDTQAGNGGWIEPDTNEYE